MEQANRDNRGMIIVFTLILLAVFLTAALGFSYFIIGDIGKAKAIDDSVVAYYAADAGMEESLYLMKKLDLPGTMASLKAARPDGASLASSTGRWDIAGSNDFEKTVLRQRLRNGQSARFFILDRSGANQTKSFTLEWYRSIGTSAKLQVSLTQLSPQFQGETLVYYTDFSQVENADTLSSGNAAKCFDLRDASLGGGTLATPSDYSAEFTVLGTDADFVDRLLVKAYDKSCSGLAAPADFEASYNPQGITNLTLKSRGSFGRAAQTIVAHILPKDSVSGLFGFVLFSEEDVAKE